MRNRFYSPLRYPGGKTKLAPFIKSIFYENDLVGMDYVEPYAGGAGVALSLLFDEYVSAITINDFDRSIYAFWHSVIHENERFCKEIKKIKINVKNWEKQKDIQRKKDEADLFSLGFSTFYLNRTNVSGVIKGGIIGGKKQTGKYKIDARFNKYDLIKRIKRIEKYAHKINITNKDAIDILADDLEGCFVYLDPPYSKKAQSLYMNFYSKNDHENIAKALLSKKEQDFLWLLSYDKSDIIYHIYKKCKKIVSWQAGYGISKQKNEELLFFHSDLDFRHSKNLLCT